MFSLFPSHHYADLNGMGINAFFGLQMFGAFDGKTKSEQLASQQDVLDRILADGNDFLPRLNIAWNKELMAKYPRIGKDGQSVKKGNYLDASNPEVRAELKRLARTTFEDIGHHPAVSGVHVCSEVRDHSRVSFTLHTSNAWAKASGGRPLPEGAEERVGPHFRTIPNFPKGRVVPDDYPLLAFYRWFWREGDGWVNHFNDMVDETHASFGKESLTFYAPAVRCPPLWRADAGKVNIQGHWTYANPLPYAINYVISEQQEMLKGSPGTLLITDVQGISYRSRTAPKGAKVANEPDWVKERPNALYITTPPDMAVEAFWWAFARRTDGIGLYGWRALFDAVPAGIAATASNYQYTNPKTFPRIADLFRKVAVPLGPLFRAVPERPPEVAILESSAATFLARRGSWGWDDAIFLTGMIATKANLMPTALYDDDIKANGIPDTVQVLLMPHCDVLTETTYSAVKQFQKRGGIVLGDKFLVPGIKPDAYIDGFGRQFYGGTGRDIAWAVAHVANKMVKAITPRYLRYATSDEPDILLHVRTFGSADYLFAINDKRQAGDYIGQYGLCLEDGMPNRGTVTVNRAAGVVYDLLAHSTVPFKSENGKTEIPVEYATSDGRLFLIARAPLSPLSANRVGEDLVITTPDRDVMIPIVMESLGRKPYYGVVKDGFWRKADAPADATVRSLADGSVAQPLKSARNPEIDSRYSDWVKEGKDPLVPADRPVAKIRKVPLSQDPSNDHDIIRMKSFPLSDTPFDLPPKGNCAAVEAWLGVPDSDFTLTVNGQDAGSYERILNPQDVKVRFDLTPFVKWGGKNVMKFSTPSGGIWLPKNGTIEVLELGK